MCDSWLRKWVIASVVCAFSPACSGDSELRSDARRFLGAYQKHSYELRGEALEKHVTALEALPLGQAEVRETRDLCVAGQRAVLAQEHVQAVNAAAIDRALAANHDGTALDAMSIARLKDQVDASQVALTGAREQLERCEAKVRALDMRFGSR